MADDGQRTGLRGLPFTVIRIRAGDPIRPNITHSGTGFFYQLDVGPHQIALIISNKHVLTGKTWIEFDVGAMDDERNRIFGPSTAVRVEPGQLPIFEHPDPSVDLAAIPLNPITDSLAAAGKKPYALLLTRENLAPESIQAVLHAATSVLMVGFPNGIMDEANNLPVVRRGTLATPYGANYRGRTDFVIDIAAFGGSSGSPIFALFEHILPDSGGNISFMTRPLIHLIGVLHSGPMMTAEGLIVPAPVPTSFLMAQTNVMIHLGYCAKAFRIEELAPVIEAYGKASS
ncbi:S1 family peptidase [Mesorhizobium captivum]|uniref:S1 family peptidase n=1 Tax=Mesorhizobium captivum TaxID=3072319 RepID=UPI002A246ED8|nr:trypsin-like peptidase domain-containing protein [Mesorhizobium sp. VK3C]MDX8446547.1 trypsin-like peptidase domain-containing protein [Mesorhizobium sp. VK3C]